ncbi:MAG: hypothetical protein ACRDMJ_09850 [Solirubrobacteraceae bacterium]
MRPGRLRRGEIAAALAAVGLIVLLIIAPWFASRGGESSGWASLPGLRWLILAAAAAGLALAFAQAACSAPALPSTLSMIATVLGAVTSVALIVRLPTAAGEPRAGAYAGLAAALALSGAALDSLARESGWRPGPERPIETVPLGPPEAGAGA